MTHLSAGERLAMIEAEAEPAHPHLETCAPCRTEVARMRALLREARLVEVPDPSPLFWDRFARRVSDAVSSSKPTHDPGGWPFWRVLVPLTAAVAALLVAVVVERGPQGRSAGVPQVAPAEQLDGGPAASADDEQWDILSVLAADFDLETLSDSLGRAVASGAGAAVWQLDERERAELGALLRDELRQRP